VTDRDFVKNMIPLLAYKPLARFLKSPSSPPSCRRCSNATSVRSKSCASAPRKRRHDFFRHHRPRTRGLQQVHSVLSPSRFDLQHRGQQEFVPGQGFGRVEPLVETPAHRQSRQDLRTLRRRRPRPRRSHLVRRHPERSRPQSRAGDRRGVARQRPPAGLTIASFVSGHRFCDPLVL
jgi:hypothetical protein